MYPRMLPEDAFGKCQGLANERKQSPNRRCVHRVEYGGLQWRLATYSFRNQWFRNLLVQEKCSSSDATLGRETTFRKVA